VTVGAATPDRRVISYAQNFEDVMLARALRGKTDGFYIDVGAMDPVVHSVTCHFYEQGWHGINVEPVHHHFARLVAERPRDINLNFALGEREEERPLYEVADSGLSSLDSAIATAAAEGHGYPTGRAATRVTTLAHICAEHAAGRVIDFLKIDVEGWERQVIAGNDWRRFRPRIVLVEATRPNSPEPAWADWEPILLANDYLFVWFDGLNRFYVRREDAPLKAHFTVPPNVFDDFILWDVARLDIERARVQEEHARLSESHMRLIDDHTTLEEAYVKLENERAKLEQDLARANGLATERAAEIARQAAQLDAVYRSRSWRITAPIRWLGERIHDRRR
jgi:FkbM family methyltransferase